MSDADLYESLESAGVYGSLGAPSPLTSRSLHCTGSTNSSASHLSEDDPLYQTCYYQPNNSKADSEDASDGSVSLDDKPQRNRRFLRPTSELFTSAKTSLSRSASTRSYLRGSSSSASSSSSAPGPEKQQCGAFNSLQRKSKRTSIRRRLLKYIPGLNRALEEEESKL